MENNIKVSSAPIQRNAFDVAVELTQLYKKSVRLDSVEVIQDTFLKFYAVAKIAEVYDCNNLIEYLPEDFKKIIKPNK